jgi:adenylosuccinate lyase
MDEPRFADARVSDAGIRQLFATEHRWQRWLEVERALADAQAELGIVPHEAAAITAAAHLGRPRRHPGPHQDRRDQHP